MTLCSLALRNKLFSAIEIDGVESADRRKIIRVYLSLKYWLVDEWRSQVLYRISDYTKKKSSKMQWH